MTRNLEFSTVDILSSVGLSLYFLTIICNVFLISTVPSATSKFKMNISAILGSGGLYYQRLRYPTGICLKIHVTDGTAQWFSL